jgi:hypothetical protein
MIYSTEVKTCAVLKKRSVAEMSQEEIDLIRRIFYIA